MFLFMLVAYLADRVANCVIKSNRWSGSGAGCIVCRFDEEVGYERVSLVFPNAAVGGLRSHVKMVGLWAHKTDVPWGSHQGHNAFPRSFTINLRAQCPRLRPKAVIFHKKMEPFFCQNGRLQASAFF